MKKKRNPLCTSDENVKNKTKESQEVIQMICKIFVRRNQLTIGNEYKTKSIPINYKDKMDVGRIVVATAYTM